MRATIMASIVGLAILAVGISPADAAKRGPACGCQPTVSQPACCAEQIQYEERQITCYKTVYEEVKEKTEVPTVQYVPAIELREVMCTICQPVAPPACGPAACAAPTTCGPTTCGPAVCCQPIQCMRKIPHEVLREVPATKIVETVRIVEKQIPYTITCYIPKPVCQVPVCAPACGK